VTSAARSSHGRHNLPGDDPEAVSLSDKADEALYRNRPGVIADFILAARDPGSTLARAGSDRGGDKIARVLIEAARLHSRPRTTRWPWLVSLWRRAVGWASGAGRS
jgi:hypothetical protein